MSYDDVVDRLTEQNQVMQEALGFYADPTNWDEDSFISWTPIVRDRGDIARYALTAIGADVKRK